MTKAIYPSMKSLRAEHGGETQNEWAFGRGHTDDLGVFTDNYHSAPRYQDNSATLALDTGILYATDHLTGRVAILARTEAPLPLKGQNMTLCIWRLQQSIGSFYGERLSALVRAFNVTYSAKLQTPGMKDFYNLRGGADSEELTYLDVPNDLGCCDAPFEEALRVGYVHATGDIYAYAKSTDRVELLGTLRQLYREDLLPYTHRQVFRWWHDPFDGPKSVSWFKSIGIVHEMEHLLYSDDHANDLNAEQTLLEEVLSDAATDASHVIRFPSPFVNDVPNTFSNGPRGVSALGYIPSTGHWYLHTQSDETDEVMVLGICPVPKSLVEHYASRLGAFNDSLEGSSQSLALARLRREMLEKSGEYAE